MLAAVCLCLSGGSQAIAQTQIIGDAPSDGETKGIVDVKVLNFGLGGGPAGAIRPGDWIGIQIEILNRSEKVREVVLQVPEADPDGDEVERRSSVAANPGVRQKHWIFTRLPFRATTSSVLTISVFDAVESSKTVPGLPRFETGKLLGSTTVRPSQLLPATMGFTAVVGTRDALLSRYDTMGSFGRLDYPVSGHELMRVAGGLKVADLPDRWMGYCGVDTLVWTGTGVGELPQELSEGQSEAMREWLQRGGRLVVVLPQTGQSWIGRADHPLRSVLPEVTLAPEERTPLEAYRQLLVAPNARLAKEATVNVMVPKPGAAPGEAVRVLNGPGGRCVVARRLVGTGMVTVSGIDVAAPAFLAGTPEFGADRFWNRILGRRDRHYSQTELDRLNQRGGMMYAGRQDKFLEESIRTGMSKTTAAAGLLLAFVVFLAYWLLAGPIGFFALRMKSLVHHAWVSFVLAAAAFTVIAWGGATMIKPRKIEGSHLTILDHVYGQSNQRARSWLDVLLPSYAMQRVSLGQGADKTHNALAPWERPLVQGGVNSFPDAQAYPAEGRDPATLVVPARSTVKQFQADWAGMCGWAMPRPVVPEGGPLPLGSEIQLVDIPMNQRRSGERSWALKGQLSHQLPGTLREVYVFIVRRQAPLTASVQTGVVGNAFAFKVNDWDPGDVLDLDRAIQKDIAKTSAAEFFESLIGRPSSGFAGQITTFDENRRLDTSERTRRLLALSFFDLLQPHDPSGQQASWVARRQSVHGWDLSAWFTEPCIIIVGQLDGKDVCPVPVQVDGKDVPLTGTTLLRWVYPLADNPPEYRTDSSEAAPAASDALEQKAKPDGL